MANICFVMVRPGVCCGLALGRNWHGPCIACGAKPPMGGRVCGLGNFTTLTAFCGGLVGSGTSPLADCVETGPGAHGLEVTVELSAGIASGTIGGGGGRGGGIKCGVGPAVFMGSALDRAAPTDPLAIAGCSGGMPVSLPFPFPLAVKYLMNPSKNSWASTDHSCMSSGRAPLEESPMARCTTMNRYEQIKVHL